MCICFRTGCRHTEWVCLQCSHMCRCPCVCNYRTVCPRMGRGREEAEGLSLGKSSQPHSSVGKESACNSGDPSSIGVGRIHWRRDRLPTTVFLGFPCGSAGKESTCNAGDLSWEDPLEKGKSTLPTPVFWPGEFHELYSPWDCKESDTTERLSIAHSTVYLRFHIHGFNQSQLFSILVHIY